MPNLQDLRRRVRAVKNMQQITRAMKMVAAARLRRAQERVIAARPYTAKMTQILGDVARRTPDYRDPLLVGHQGATGQGQKILVLVTADKGLCGAFNTNLIKTAQEFLREREQEQIELVLIGRKGYEYFRRRRIKVRREHLNITGTGRVNAADAAKIAQALIADFNSEENPVESVFLIYNEFKSALQQKPVLKRLLPVGQVEAAGDAGRAQAETLVDYLYEQPPAELFGQLLPKLVENRIYHALLESVASELGARMTAMDSASKNATEVIDKLTLKMNRVRQAAITREIIEVVSGAEAL